MIGDFRYMSNPPEGVVVVSLLASALDDDRARLLLPESLLQAMTAAELSPATKRTSVAAALAYGVFLAMKANVPLVVTGDLAAWNVQWGVLRQGLTAERIPS